MNIVQTFLNEDVLYRAVVDLPNTANFLGTITAVATHSKFKILEENVSKLIKTVGLTGSPINNNYDIHKLWSDDMTFSQSGYLFCGKPFPRSNNIRFVDRIFSQEDFNGPNKEELDIMPSKFYIFKLKLHHHDCSSIVFILFIAQYCKQLYLDVTNTNNGKITWNYIKPIIQGKFLYGPVNAQTNQIIQNVSLNNKYNKI